MKKAPSAGLGNKIRRLADVLKTHPDNTLQFFKLFPIIRRAGHLPVAFASNPAILKQAGEPLIAGIFAAPEMDG